MSEADFLRQKNKFLAKVKAYVDENCPGESIIPYSAEFEAKFAEIEEPAAKQALLDEHKVRTQLPKIVTTGYHLLRLIHFFTAGADEVKCWTIRDPCKVRSRPATRAPARLQRRLWRAP
jgi:obg-like ATPase 1